MDLETPELSERPLPAKDRQPINNEMSYHPYVESEFPEGRGHCDQCGGGPDAALHVKPVDQMKRIADALELIGDLLDFVVKKAMEDQ
jgi:hypothetical protein